MAPCRSNCRSNCRQSILFFLFVFGSLQFAIMALSSIFRSTLTFVEKQFQIDSKTSGFISSGNELASLLLILPVTYFGCRFHRPFCIAVGGILVAVAYACLGLPHFFLPDWRAGPPTNHSGDANASDLCVFSNGSSTTTTPLPPSTTSPRPSAGEPNRLWTMLFLAQLVAGIGASHIYSYGGSYVDDFADKAKSPLYFGILMSINLLGPGFGHVFGAWTSSVYVDADRHRPSIDHSDPRWVGAWWLGPIILSLVVAVASIALFLFPRSMNAEEFERDLSPLVTESVNHFTINDGGDTKMKLVQLSYWDFVKAFPKVTMRLFKNPVFTLMILCFGALMALVAVLAVFQPKYMQEEFGITSSHANFLIGAVKLPFGIVGTLSGGAILGRLKLNLQVTSLTVLVISLLGAGLLTCNFFIGCETRRVGGITANLNKSFKSCVKNCDCVSGIFDPVCGDDGIEYSSPCQAGCTIQIQQPQNGTIETGKNFTDCRCLQPLASSGVNVDEIGASLDAASIRGGAVSGISGGAVSGISGGAVFGICKNPPCAKKAYVYIAVGSLHLFLSGLIQAPLITILLRSIAVEDKSFGLGIMMLAGRLLGWIPMPPLTGALIDSTCLSWSGVDDSGGAAAAAAAKKGACRLYDADALRNKYWGLLVGLYLTIVTLFACIAVYIRVKKFDGHVGGRKASSSS